MKVRCRCGVEVNVLKWPLHCDCGERYASAAEMALRTMFLCVKAPDHPAHGTYVCKFNDNEWLNPDPAARLANRKLRHGMFWPGSVRVVVQGKQITAALLTAPDAVPLVFVGEATDLLEENHLTEPGGLTATFRPATYYSS